jgi:hypothetical protein
MSLRLLRLLQPTAIIAFVTFIVAYVRRKDTHDVGNWLFFILVVSPPRRRSVRNTKRANRDLCSSS